MGVEEDIPAHGPLQSQARGFLLMNSEMNQPTPFMAALAEHGPAACPDNYEDCETCFVRDVLPMLEGDAKGDCRCGRCCTETLIEVSALDALREPRIAAEGVPYYGMDPLGEIDRTGEPIGYILNSPNNHYGCAFFEHDPTGGGRCGIYATRPTVCRAFHCTRWLDDKDGGCDDE